MVKTLFTTFSGPAILILTVLDLPQAHQEEPFLHLVPRNNLEPGRRIPEMPAWPWNAVELLGKEASRHHHFCLSATPALLSHTLTAQPPMFSISQRLILTLKMTLSFIWVLSTTAFGRNLYDICDHAPKTARLFPVCH